MTTIRANAKNVSPGWSEMSEISYPRRWKRPPVLIRDRRWRMAIYGGSLIWLVLAIGAVNFIDLVIHRVLGPPAT